MMSSIPLCPEIEAVLDAIEPQRTTKVLLLGNSGVGKSFLLNVMQEEDEFESRYSGTAVTRTIELGVLQPTADDSAAYILYNIPGLLDPSKEVAAENSRQIESAFRDRGNLPVITLFVLTVEGGRIRADDLEAWRAITRFAPDIETETAVAFVVNKMESDDFESKAEQDNYELNLQRQLRTYCSRPYTVYFLPKLSSQDRKCVMSAGRLKTRATLMAALRGLRGHAVHIAEGARLKLDYEIMKEEIAKTKARMTEMMQKFEREQQENAKAHQEALAAMQRQNEERSLEMKRAHEREMEAMKAQIEELKSRPPPGFDMRALEAQLSMMQQQSSGMMQTPMQALLYGGGHRMPLGPSFGHSPQMYVMDDEDFSPSRSHGRTSHSRSSHSHRSSRSREERRPLTWNTFRTANKGLGYSMSRMSKEYAKYKKSL